MLGWEFLLVVSVTITAGIFYWLGYRSGVWNTNYKVRKEFMERDKKRLMESQVDR